MLVKMETLNICNNKYYPLDLVNSIFEPLIGFDYKKCNNYTTIMIDRDAVNEQNVNLTYKLLHYLKVNNSVVIDSYLPPAPRNDKIHTYEFLIYKQKCCMENIDFVTREDFKLKQFVKKYHLKLVGSVKFKTSRILA